MTKKNLLETHHCTECRKDLLPGEYRKDPLGYSTKEGKLVPSEERFAFFCKICGKFLSIIDFTVASKPKYQSPPIITNSGSSSGSST